MFCLLRVFSVVIHPVCVRSFSSSSLHAASMRHKPSLAAGNWYDGTQQQSIDQTNAQTVFPFPPFIECKKNISDMDDKQDVSWILKIF